MATLAATGDPALEAYEALAPFYDAYTDSYEHERWLAQLEAIALELGLSGHRLLDVGCGTGKSALPLLARGYEVVGCDISPAMVERARERLSGEAVELLAADVRDLPSLGQFDLATCLDDTLNYLLSEEELAAAFQGLARNLRPGGLLVFDLNSLATYRSSFAADAVVESEEAVFCWRGTTDPGVQPGALASAVLEVFATDDGECWRRIRSTHVQRHHPPEEVARLLRDCGFELIELYGQFSGAHLEQPADEARHVKLVYFARHAGWSLAFGSD
jgi:SAM-dependent methyltransferase